MASKQYTPSTPPLVLPDLDESVPEILAGKRILLVNHSDTLGVAASPSFRLMQALRRRGLDVRMLVYTRTTSEPTVSSVGSRLVRGLRYTLERLHIMAATGLKPDNIFAVSTGSWATNIHHHPWVKEADIVCLNWINQGLMNIEGIRALHRMGKHIVWTIHDMWPFTGICHHSRQCEYYRDNCGNCMYLRGGGKPGDLSRRMWEKKQQLFSELPITFVATSKALEQQARSSSLLRNCAVMTIHAPILVDSFYTYPAQHIDSLLSITKPNLILVVSPHLDVSDKSIDTTISALNTIFDNEPELASETAVYLLGHMSDPSKLDALRMSHRWLGHVNDNNVLRYLYSEAKVVISTSMLNDTSIALIEGMAGGAIPVTFDGLPCDDVIEHMVNGYNAAAGSADDLARGISWALSADIDRDSQHEHVKAIYSPDAVAQSYIDLFAQLL
ncbi:MAG: glycosyltransferase [Duncaniella sp.]|nr:glycosyltransferase [Duncaniella sp.]